jgi:hypothetical protein
MRVPIRAYGGQPKVDMAAGYFITTRRAIDYSAPTRFIMIRDV